MNLRRLVIAFSLLANIALALGLVWRAAPRPELPERGSPDASASSVANSTAVAGPQESEPTPDDWHAMTSGSLAEIAARLQAHGYPLQLQRVILRALVSEQFAPRHRAIADLMRARPWWSGWWGSTDGARILRARQQLHREEEDVVAALLGPDTDSSEYIKASRRYRYGDLSPDTQAALDRINADYNELSGEMKNSWAGILLPEDREKLLFLERERRADIAQLLPPAELFEYDLRSSPESWWLRQLTGSMELSEAEFRALFQVRSEHIAPFSDGQYQLMNAADRAALKQLEPQLEAKIQTVLTPERFAEYQLKTSEEYRQTDALVKRLELPANATAEIVGLQKEFTQRASAVRANATLSTSERNAQLTALVNEAIARLKLSLGENGLAAYQQTAGRWLTALPSPPPAPGGPKG